MVFKVLEILVTVKAAMILTREEVESTIKSVLQNQRDIEMDLIKSIQIHQQ